MKLGRKRRKSSKRNYYTISPRVMIKAIIIIWGYFIYTCIDKTVSMGLLFSLRVPTWGVKNAVIFRQRELLQDNHIFIFSTVYEILESARK